jgi:hypothetical protein
MHSVTDNDAFAAKFACLDGVTFGSVRVRDGESPAINGGHLRICCFEMLGAIFGAWPGLVSAWSHPHIVFVKSFVLTTHE